MQIAAILTVAAEQSPRHAVSLIGRNTQETSRSYAQAEILGASLLDRTLRRLETLGTLPPKVLSGGNISDHVLPSRSSRPGSFIESWEKAVSGYVNDGVESILLVRVGTHTDIDYRDFLRFHRETSSPLSHACSGEISLDIAVVDATLLRNTDDLLRRVLSHLIPQQKRFRYEGYVNRLRNREELHRLMGDGLQGRCQLRPVGTQIRPGVWCGDGAEIDPTVSIDGPAFIGARAKIAAGCKICGTSSIERDCQIDCGTVIDSSLVLPGTYIGVALDVRRSVVASAKLFNLDRNLEVRVSDARLIGKNKRSVAPLAALTALLGSEVQAGD